MYPQSVIPVWLEVPIAIYLGYLIYKRGKGVMTWSIIAVITMYITVIIGAYVPVKMPAIAGIPPTGVWTIILLTYAFIASILQVTTLLQPCDFINSHQLVVAMSLLVLGILVSAFSGRLEIVAPALQTAPAEAPPCGRFCLSPLPVAQFQGLIPWSLQAPHPNRYVMKPILFLWATVQC
jgi:carbon starvation protein